MRELALHILDLVQNSIEAGASKVILEVIESASQDLLTIRVADNGRGMDSTTIEKVRDPFVTTRNTRRVGLGIPLIDMTTKNTEGYLKIYSGIGSGTVIEAVFKHSHLDRPPLGDMAETIKSIIIANPDLNFCYSHNVNGKIFSVETKELAEILDGVSFTHPEVLIWLNEYLSSHIANLYGGVLHENS